MRLIRSTAIIGSLTLVSRILGLVRDVLTARFLGAGVVTDALFTAFKLPNLFRRVFAEGAFNAAFIPLYARRLEEDGERAADAFASEALSALLVLVCILVALIELFMPFAISGLGFGLDRIADPESGVSPFRMAVLFSYITMPYLIFMSLTALFSGILNTRHYFAIAAAAPILLNIALISVLGFAAVSGWSKVTIAMMMAIGMSVSGVLQVGLLIYGCRRAGLRIGLRRPRITPGVRRLFVLGVPGAIAAGITQINLVVSHSIATTQQSAASWLSYADRLYQLPLGMIGIAMGVALLPALTRRLRADDEAGAMMSFNRAIEIAAFLTLPATVALAVMPDLLVGGLFQRGEFGSTATTQTAQALRMFAIGLPAFVLIKVLTPAFFAREDTQTPMKFAAASAIINVVVGVTLFKIVGFWGLALATSIAAWFNVACLYTLLTRNAHLTPDQRLLFRLPKIMLASAVMGVALHFIVPYFAPYLSGSFIKDFGVLIVVSGIGFAIYALAAFALRAFSLRDIKDSLGR